jgi:uncharacterized protein
MISSLATPGVYVKEVDGFPPSIAQVATAIPAFIGYAEKGALNKPVKITSLLEFNNKFGGSPAPETILTIDPGNNTYEVEESKFKLYNSIKLFFNNGGGECYIVPIDHYKNKPVNWIDAAVRNKFITGINTLEKVDEVTLILFPDAINLGSANLGKVHEQALAQCADLMDRFTIMDVIQSSLDGTSLEADSLAFRERVGNKNLKYGAAYYPYLKASFPYKFRFSDINTVFSLKPSNPTMDSKIDAYLALYDEVKKFDNDWNAPAMETHKDRPSDAPITSALKVKKYVEKIWNMLAIFKDPSGLPDDAANSNQFDIKTDTEKLINGSLKPLAQSTFDFETEYKVVVSSYAIVMTGTMDDTYDNSSWKNGADFIVSAPNPFDKKLSTNPEGANDDPDYAQIEAELNKLHTQVISTMDGVIATLKELDLKKEDELISELPNYSAILNGLSGTMNTIPPSGAIAGIYADTDAKRGVWKAPANVSVSGIDGFTADINDKEQQTMNVHETGKSINALRAFTGRGKLVWGARTLDGNSNDWRYVNVRRLANMIEESSKKACMSFVFEPNVKQTWVNVKGMISNYLTTLWGDGALAGAKPEDAFFVSVGLNETMTSDDINNGRMIVKIGYAPSRPAEFIVLEFIQIQQKS